MIRAILMRAMVITARGIEIANANHQGTGTD